MSKTAPSGRDNAAGVPVVGPAAVPGPETVLVLRTCDADLRSYRGFQWPSEGDGGAGRAIVGGTATAGYGGTATAGYGGTVQVRWWDNKAERYRTATGDTGENGIEPNVAYHVLNGRLVVVNQPNEAKA